MMENKWSIPKVATNLDIVFGPRIIDEYLPVWEEIPEDFKAYNGRGEAKKWVNIIDDWFFNGIKNIIVESKQHVDKKVALQHLKTIMGSFDSQHEHKTAGCAYLLSLWFDVFEYEKAKREKDM